MKNAQRLQKCSLIAVKDRLPVATRPRTSSAVVLHPKIENKNCCCIIYSTFETFFIFLDGVGWQLRVAHFIDNPFLSKRASVGKL